MARIIVLGGSGYAGSNIVAAAAQRGHQVVSVSRHASESLPDGVEHVAGDVRDAASLRKVIEGADVVVSALSPRGDLEPEGVLPGVEKTIASIARSAHVRFGVVGGAGSLLVSDGGPQLSDTDAFPDAIKPEAATMATVLADLRADETDLDWFFVSPAAGFGGFNPGEATGTFRIGGDVLLSDENGESFISGADFALAIVQEIEEPAHRRTRFSVAY